MTNSQRLRLCHYDRVFSFFFAIFSSAVMKGVISIFKSIRYKVAIYLAKRAGKCIEKGDFKNIMKGFRYMKYSLYIVPYSKEVSNFVDDIRRTAEEHRK